jgi:2-hydroxychromene-2-carboxylate isomerase
MAMEFWFEFASTYSYPAALRIEALARSQGVPIVWKPFLLGPVFRSQGWTDSPFNLFPVKGRYMWRDLERICMEHSIPFRRPSQFPRNGLLAARIACWFEGEPWVPEFVRCVYRANFSEDLDIFNVPVLENCLERLGQPGAAIIQQAQSPESKDKLRAQTERAVTLGIFGAPTFVVGPELFWGNDRLEAALSWYKSHQPAGAVKQLT